jgi:hypothetical protein
MKKNNGENAGVSVLGSHRIECTNYMFGALREGGIVLQAKEFEKVIEQVSAMTEFSVDQSKVSVKQFFSKELFYVDRLVSSYTGTCESVTIEMLSDESYHIRISHKARQDEVYAALPLPSKTFVQKGVHACCFVFVLLNG